MALQLAPNYIGNGGYLTPVENDRRLVQTIFGIQGVTKQADFTVTPGTGLTVNIAAGVGIIAGKENVSQGYYLAYSPSSEVLAWPGPSASARIDALILCIIDKQYGSSALAEGAQWVIIQGTPSGSPTAPTDADINAVFKPGGWMRIANIRINVGDTTVNPANITMTRTFCLMPGRMLARVNLAALPTSGVEIGTWGLALDTSIIYFWNGSAWRTVKSSFQTFTISSTSITTGGPTTLFSSTAAVPAGCQMVDIDLSLNTGAVNNEPIIIASLGGTNFAFGSGNRVGRGSSSGSTIWLNWRSWLATPPTGNQTLAIQLSGITAAGNWSGVARLTYN